MFQFLRDLFGRSDHPFPPVIVQPPPSSRVEASSQRNAHLPSPDASNLQDAFVRREAILDRSEKIAGYEFSLLMTVQERLLRRGGMAKRAYDAALLTRLTVHQETPSLLGRRLAFINLSSASLENTLVDTLPKENTVLVLDLLQQRTDWNDLSPRLESLQKMGFLCGLSLHESSEATNPLMHTMDFIQINIPAFNGIDLRELSRELRALRADGRPPLRLIARNVQSHDDFQFCRKCGFDYFQGPFITSRESLRPMRADINRMSMLSILNMVRADESFEKIAAELKNEPTLTYKLLRYLNSPAMALHQPVDNLTQALQLVGREKFYRWTSLLLFEFSDPSYREHTLTERALARGRTLELLAGQGKIPNDTDPLFLTGLFSLLDAALDRPLPELVAQATLPEPVRAALLGLPGAHTDALALAKLGEADTATPSQAMAHALDRCGIDDTTYTLAAAAALVWANEVTTEAE